MHYIFENCNTAWPTTVDTVRFGGVRRESRNGPVLEYPNPVIVTYNRPIERVLFCPVRNINPFLHFFEPLWILAGRNDVAFLASIVSRFQEYSDDGKTFNAAYGHRLRQPNDQILEAIKRLKRDREDRQVVLQIRRPDDIFYTGKDTACNISVALKVRKDRLDIHVFNRSNDVVWGGPAGGANFPQFTSIQEYIAGCAGVGIGRYHHTTDSMHAYVDSPDWARVTAKPLPVDNPYEDGTVRPFRMFDPTTSEQLFNEDLTQFFCSADPRYLTQYFQLVVGPMWRAFKNYKLGQPVDLDAIQASDWQLAVKNWLARKNKA
jgi:hypothetical protein